MQNIQSVLKLTRLFNLIIIALCQLLLASYIENIPFSELFNDWKFLAIMASTLMIAGGGNVINDYYDVKIDYINKPEKVVVGKSISRRSAILLHAFLSYGGILIALSVSWKLAAADTLIVVLLWFYSNRLKCTPLWGNITVGLLTSMVVIVLPMYFGIMHQEYLIYAYFAFFITIIRELIKDLEDIRGDVKFDCNTFPKAYGLRKSLKTLVFFESIFLISLVVALLVNHTLHIYIYSTISILSPTVFLIYKSIISTKKEDFSLLSFAAKIIVLFGIISAVLL